MAVLNSFILFKKKYTTNQNQNDQGYAFKDSVRDCVQKITIACIFASFTIRDLPEFWWHYKPLLLGKRLICQTNVGYTEEC